MRVIVLQDNGLILTELEIDGAELLRQAAYIEGHSSRNSGSIYILQTISSIEQKIGEGILKGLKLHEDYADK